MIDVCHREGIRVIARTDFSKIRREVYEQHPEWAYRTPAGEIVDYNGDVHACINGGFQREYMLEILRETLTELPVDGIYFNMAGYQTRDYSGVYHGICHCENCRRMFREQYGMELPKREDMADPAYRRYLEFKKETEAEHGRRVCEMIRSIRPDILIHRDTYTTDSAYMREEDSTALDRGLPYWQYIGSEQSKSSCVPPIPVTGSQTATWILSTSPFGSSPSPPRSRRCVWRRGLQTAAVRTII